MVVERGFFFFTGRVWSGHEGPKNYYVCSNIRQNQKVPTTFQIYIQCFIAKPKGMILLMATFVVVNERSAWFGAFVEFMGTSKCSKALCLANVRLIAKYKPVLSVVLPPCTSLSANNLREKDANECACKIFRLNHPETQIRNEYVEDFLDLIKECDKLCKKNKQLGDVVYVSKLDGQTNCECRFVVRNNSMLG
ncbi:bromo adjacent homology (BAH) domain protein [Artemisia annua]|uniref:Bromo adjacent homology (BAH) domain protein n=1 Tax=Artemisia annua TaxID=35608 RepID=A0A2U1L552_ARTAN|nr:bromo adjacent homology (BAH) domain protein [Artemisia annua]